MLFSNLNYVREEPVWRVHSKEQHWITNLLRVTRLTDGEEKNDLLPICFENWNFTIGFAKKKNGK